MQALDNGEVFDLAPATGEPRLTEREAREYAKYCETIVNEMGSFLRVGLALKRIKEKKLYREKYKTFELCVRGLFDLAARRAQQIMQSAEVVEQLSAQTENAKNSSHFDFTLPKTESQAAALLQVPQQERAALWLKAVEQSEGKVTAKKISETIRQEGAATIKKQAEEGAKASRSAKGPHAPFEDAYFAFATEVSNAYMADWAKVSKKDVLSRLNTLIHYIEIH